MKLLKVFFHLFFPQNQETKQVLLQKTDSQSFMFFGSRNLKKLTVICIIGSDLMKEHLREIRSLRQRLEDSIQTNDRLRQQLEGRLACAASEKGTTTEPIWF